jgi:hypothetical protein
MKGPYERSKYDFHRVWECPKCSHRERATGQATYAFCAKKQYGILCDSPMKMAEDEPRLRTHAANGKDNSNPRTVEPSTTDTKRNRTPNRLSPTGELKSDLPHVETPEPVEEVAAIEEAPLPALELPRVAPLRSDSDSSSKDPPKAHSSSPSEVKPESDESGTSDDAEAAEETNGADSTESDSTDADSTDADATGPEASKKEGEQETHPKKKRRGRRRNNRGGGKK